MKSRSISICIITRNRENYLAKCLLSLQTQKKELLKEILVIDNASSDSTKSIVTALPKKIPIRYIYEQHIGIAHARNRALKEAKGELLAFIDDDCEASPTWIEEMVKSHKKYPQAAVIQGKVIFTPQKSFFAKSFALGYDFWIWRSRISKDYIGICDTSNVLINRKKVASLRIHFDTEFNRGSDVDFAQQLLEKNQKILYTENAVVFASVRTNLFALFRQRYLIGKASKQLENKWGVPQKLSEEKNSEYKNRLQEFYSQLSFVQRCLFSLYKPLYQLGRNQLKTEIKNNLIREPLELSKKTSNISVAVITRDRKNFLRRCLKSLAAQTKLPLEVIIVDNASGDGTYEYVVSEIFPFPLQYVYEKNVGVVYARNRALKEVKGELLAFIDDDCEASPTWIEKMEKALKKYPHAAAIQGKCFIYPPRGVISAVMQYLYDYGIQKYLFETKLFTLDAANLLLRVPLLKDRNIVFTSSQYYGEDIDMCYQLWYNNKHVHYVPDAIIYSWRRFSKFALAKRQYDKGWGRAALNKKWKTFYINSEFIINGKKIPLTRREKQQHDKIFSRVVVPRKNYWYDIKVTTLIFLYKLFFQLGVLRGKGMYDYISANNNYTNAYTSNVPISVGVITRNRAKKLRRLLESLEKQTTYPKEVLVVDNNSSDNTKKIVLSFGGKLPIRYIHEKNIGIPFARNTAIKEGKEDLLAFIDDDCEASPTWIEEMANAYKKYPQTAAIQGKTIHTPEGTIKSQIVSLKNWYWFSLNMFNKNRLSILDTKNILLNKKIIEKRGLSFDNQLIRSSDVDFGKQLVAHHQEIIYEEKILVYHYARENIFSFLKRYYFIGRGKAFIEYKWPERPLNSTSLHLENQEKIKTIGKDLTFFRKIVFLTLYRLSSWIFTLGYMRNRYSLYLLDIKQADRPTVDVSVCIVTNDRPNDLFRCLFSLLRQSYIPKEVIIVDSSKDSETTQKMTKQFKKLPIKYHHEPSQGIGHARNTAISNASGELLAFIDDDCEAGPTWIEEMANAHKKYPKSTAIQGKVFLVPFKGILTKICQEEYDKWVKENVQENGSFLSLDFENTSFKRNLLVRKALWCDTRYEKYYYDDDVDFGYQLLHTNEEIRYVPSAYIFSKRKKTFFALLKQRWLQGRSRAVVDIKWDYVREGNSQYLKGKKIPVALKKLPLGDNPFSINTDHYVTDFAMRFYPLVKKIFFRMYTLGYGIQIFLLEHDFSRLDDSYLPKTDTSMRKNTVSVMIVTKDRKSWRESLDSLKTQSILPYEVIIIDSSREPIQKEVNMYKKFFKIVYIYQPKLGFGIARNTAMRTARGNIVATLDDDATADPYWIENIQKAHLGFPESTAIQGKIFSMPKNSIIALVEQLHIEKWFLRRLKGENSFYTMSTKNISFKRKDFFAYKLHFAENKLYGLYGSEDVDMAFQMTKKKLPITYEPSIQVFHTERGTFKEYFLQQYRKGMASPLIERDWQTFIKKRKMYLSLPKFLDLSFTIIKNPLTKKKFFLYPSLFAVYILADYFYYKGKVKMKEILTYVKKQRILPISVLIISNTPQVLKEQLFRLVHQSTQPKKIILISRRHPEIYTNTLGVYEPLLPIIHFNFEKREYNPQEVIKEVEGKILTFLDPQTIPSYFWLESIEKAHQEYSDTLIQGMTYITKKSNLYNVIMQFNRQTFIRNTLAGQKNLYWKWMRGELSKDFYVHVHDTYNISLKNTDKYTQRNIVKNVVNEIDVYNMLSHKKLILSPAIKVYKTNDINFHLFFTWAFYYGSIYAQWYKQKGIFTTRRTKNPVRSVGAFVYYCLKNNRVLFLPILISFFILYELTFLYGFTRAQKN